MAKNRLINKIKKFLRKQGNDEFRFANENITHKNIEIGDFTYGDPEIQFVEQANLKIGKFCSIAGGVKIMLGGNHRIDWISTYPFNSISRFQTGKTINGHPATKGDIVIKNDVWIGNDALILSGVTIGNGSVIGARSVITKNIGDYEVWAGNPARLIRKRFNEEIINKLLELEWWNWEINKIEQNMQTICSQDIDELLKLK
jgi:acetyltransferase-like isoleucine patch superfamily enzyme